MSKWLLLILFFVTAEFSFGNSQDKCSEFFWQPSVHVVQRFDQAKLGPLLTLSSTDNISIEVTIDQDGLRMRATRNRNYPTSDERKTWWFEWLKKEFSPEQVSGYVESIRDLEIMFGPELEDLVQKGVTIHKPTKNSILYGGFVLNGPLAIIANFLDRSPRTLITNPTFNPKPTERGAFSRPGSSDDDSPYPPK